MEQIKRRGFTSPEHMAIETAAIDRALNHTDEVLSEYSLRADTHGGRYICADSFKSLMPRFDESAETRSRFNGAVHNAAAVLSSEQFRRLIADGPKDGRDKVMFITGIPGAGKSSSVQNHSLQPDMAVVFEGQLSRPAPTMEKIAQAQQAGFEVGIVAVHMPPEIALERTNSRFLDPFNGRGASIGVMSEIQGDLPSGLREIHQRFGNSVSLQVLDNTPGHQALHSGWSAVTVLEKEGHREHISNRLQAALRRGHAEGRFSDSFYEQAAGRKPERSMASTVGDRSPERLQADGSGRSVPQGSGQPHSLTTGAVQPSYSPRNLREAMQDLPRNLAGQAGDPRYAEHSHAERGAVAFYKGLAESMARDADRPFEGARFDDTMADRGRAAQLQVPPSVRPEVANAVEAAPEVRGRDRGAELTR
jgi:hypothetical protein